ncbi:hypothetical protein Bpfe_027503 [Biomphalaria pfeifferi]|uniref:Uncharacterized protein n=1 Tax=Biomphalaria pfeifferi TaxID=112525 RepID=A0AAD8EX13_BIOPF|nr:hypothetical protein Bpfe_027503 [Biomphalaria pfeifferi]
MARLEETPEEGGGDEHNQNNPPDLKDLNVKIKNRDIVILAYVIYWALIDLVSSTLTAWTTLSLWVLSEVHAHYHIITRAARSTTTRPKHDQIEQRPEEPETTARRPEEPETTARPPEEESNTDNQIVSSEAEETSIESSGTAQQVNLQTPQWAIANSDKEPVEDDKMPSHKTAYTAMSLSEGKRSCNPSRSGIKARKTAQKKRPPDKNKVKQAKSGMTKSINGFYKSKERKSHSGLVGVHENTNDISLKDVQGNGDPVSSRNQTSKDIQAEARGPERVPNCKTEEADQSKEKELNTEETSSNETSSNPNNMSNENIHTSDPKQERSQDVDLVNVVKAWEAVT